jgi:GTPase SAR1 family protein
MKLFSRFRKQKPVNPPVVAPEPPNLKRVKILILGTLGSGKSTFMKNFAFTKIHTSRPEEQKKEDIKTTTPSVLANVLYMFFNAGKEYFAENQDKKGTPLWVCCIFIRLTIRTNI